MRGTQVTELFANIKKTFVSFFSILMFAALGVGVFLGISWAGPALQQAGDRMLDEGAFHSFQIQYPYGLTDDDLKKLAEVEGVTQIEPAHQSFQTMMSGDEKGATVKVQTLGQDIDTALLVEGELPTKVGEMAFHASSANKLGVNVGDTITFVKDADGDSGLDALSLDGNNSEKTSSNTSGMKYLTSQSFKVTALVNSPDYLAESEKTFGFAPTPSGRVDGLAWVLDGSFDASAFQDGYPIVNVRCDELAGIGTFGEDYKARSKEVEARIAELGDTLATARYDDLHGQAQKKLDEAQKKLDDGKKQIADGEKPIADGEKTLAEKKAEGEQQLADGYQQLLYYEGLKADGEVKLAEGRTKVEKGEAALASADAAKAELSSSAANYRARGNAVEEEYKKSGKTPEDKAKRDAALDALGAEARAELLQKTKMVGYDVPVIDHTNYFDVLSIAEGLVDNFEDLPVEYEGQTMTVAEARVKLAEGRQQLADAEAEYDARVAQLNDGWATYYAGQDELNRLVAEGEAQLTEARQQVEEGKKQVAENEPKLENAKAKFAAMAKYDWTLLPRAYNAGVGEVSTFSNVTDRLSISMAALFIIVGLLVSYFAVSRIVREQITQIGTKKALGFRRGEITKSYLWYSGIAVLAGSIIGAIVGVTLVEGIIGSALGAMFAFGSYPPYFGWGLFLVVTLVYLALVLAATYLACRSILKEHAVELLKGPKPPTGKTRFYEKWGIWDKLPLLIQTIVNNCVNDKRRVFSTIVGVAGATALIVTAITLNNDVLKSYDRQYEGVYGFNVITYVDSATEKAAENVEAALQKEGAATAQVSMKQYLMEQPNGESSAIRVIVPDDSDAFAALYHVNPTAGAAFDPSAEGVWVSQAYAEHFDAKVGDMLLIDDGAGVKHGVPILGFYEFWLTYHEAVMGHDYFEKEFGSTASNVVLVDAGDVAVADLQDVVSKIDGYDSMLDDKTEQHKDFETFSTVSSAVVAIYLALAALMAVVVLLNLNVMFIDEKKRELIVLMINGFSIKDARHYISYDNIVLTALGIIAGLVLGCIMGSITVLSIEPSTATFIKAVDGWAVGIGIVGSAALALIMSMIALRRIPKFDLTDINKL